MKIQYKENITKNQYHKALYLVHYIITTTNSHLENQVVM